jgi:hypothetical protein
MLVYNTAHVNDVTARRLYQHWYSMDQTYRYSGTGFFRLENNW